MSRRAPRKPLPSLRGQLFRIGKDAAMLVKNEDLQALVRVAAEAKKAIENLAAFAGAESQAAVSLCVDIEAALEPFAAGLDRYCAVPPPAIEGAVR